ncbi:hypothetical protein KUTG_02283 [Kutzneria sp. 744]|nr:hypothetical protein KUTG_02283 [Kutzneria sp. 744]
MTALPVSHGKPGADVVRAELVSPAATLALACAGRCSASDHIRSCREDEVAFAVGAWRAE